MLTRIFNRLTFRSTSQITRAARNQMAMDSSHLDKNLGSQTTRGGLIGISTQILSMFIQIVSAGILARLLEPQDFGLVAMATVVTGFIGLFTNLGLSTATIQRKEISQDLVSGLFVINIGLGLGFMLLACAVAPLAAYIFGDPRVLPLIIGISFAIPLTALSAQHIALLSRRMKWGRVRAQSIMAQIAGAVAGVLAAAFTDLGYWSIVVASWVSALAGALIAWQISDWRPSRVGSWTEVRSAVGFGANLTVFSFANWFAQNLDNALIGWRWGPTDLGYYSRAYQLLVLPLNLIAGPITGAVLPALSRLQTEPDRWRNSILEAMSAVFFLSCAIIALLIATSDQLILFVYGPGWDRSAAIFFVLLTAMFSQMIGNVTVWIYISRGRADRMARWALYRLPLTVTGFVIGVQYGAVGVAYAFSVMATLVVVPSVLFACYNTPLAAGDVFRNAILPILAGIAASCAGRVVASQEFSQPIYAILAISAVTFGVYGVLSYIMITKIAIFKHLHTRIKRMGRRKA